LRVPVGCFTVGAHFFVVELPMSLYRTLSRTDRDGVAVITFDHPPINLVDRDLVVDLLKLAQALESDRQTRVVIFRSANPDFFLAHFDLSGKGSNKPPAPLPEGEASVLSQLFTRYSRLPQVTIGELRGRARGAGSEFLLALDMRFASRERAVLGQPEAALGIIPGAGGTVRLAQMLGRARALEVCLGCADFDADLAERYGWINRAIADAEIEAFVDEQARRIALFPESGISHVKALVDRLTAADAAGLVDESDRFAAAMKDPEGAVRMRWMAANGGSTDSAIERDMGSLLGRYPEEL
jgi:enoyl-CoA hydratase/carnithine racemase